MNKYNITIFTGCICSMLFIASCITHPAREEANETALRRIFSANRQNFEAITTELRSRYVSKVHVFNGHLNIRPEKARLGAFRGKLHHFLEVVGLESIYLDDQGVSMIATASQARDGFYISWGFFHPSTEVRLKEMILVQDVGSAPCDADHETVYEMLSEGWYLYRCIGPLTPTLFPREETRDDATQRWGDK